MGSSFEYKKLSLEEMNKRKILGRLVGICADFKNPTRNGRLYSEELWNKVFSNDIMKEKIANRCVYGELGHPSDRTEVDMEKIAVCLSEQPKKGNDGKLYAVFDILDTPNGRILKTLCDYGTQIGISSRGQGDTYTDYDGTEKVDPDTYDCEGFDVVILPAVKEARLKYMTESINNEKTLKQALQETFNNATDVDKKIMQETWNDIVDEVYPTGESEIVNDKEDNKNTNNKEENTDKKILIEQDPKDLENESLSNTTVEDNLSINEGIKNYIESHPLTENDTNDLNMLDESSLEDVDINEAVNTESANNDGDLLVSQLQSTLEECNSLKKNVKELREQLSVCNAKENMLTGKIEAYRNSINSLNASLETTKALKAKLKAQTDNLNENKIIIANKDAEIKALNEKLNTVSKFKEDLMKTSNQSLNRSKASIDSLNESINSKNLQVSKLNEDINKLTSDKEELIKSMSNLQKVNSRLTEDLKQVRAEKSISDNKLQSMDLSYKSEISSLKEQLETQKSTLNSQLAESKKDSSIKQNQLAEKLERQQKLTEKYKNIAKRAVDKYIELQASKIGVKPIEIKNKLTESYTFTDIDNIVSELSEYNIRINKLPFNTSSCDTKVTFTESYDPLTSQFTRVSGDYVDDQLLRLIRK